MKTAKSNYWLDRKIQKNLVSAERIGNKSIKQLTGIYKQALTNITKEINKVYMNYSNKVGLDVAELAQIITGAERKEFLLSIKKRMKDLGLNVEDIYDENYIKRLTRLEALKHQIYWEIMKIAPQEEMVTGKGYSKVIAQTYQKITNNIEVWQGVVPSFATIDNEVINQMLRDNWVGRNYSKSVWKNTSELAKELPQVLGGALVMGQSYQKTSRELREYLKKKALWKATRLVRTETIYFHNQAELESYKDEGIKKYEYVATLDGRTSDVCLELDDDVFLVSKAEAGKNYPPMHPNCRSTTRPVLSTGEKLRTYYVTSKGKVRVKPAIGPTKEQKRTFVENARKMNKTKKG